MANTLFIGKDLPDGLELAEALTASGRKVYGVARSESETMNFEAENIFTSTWNKSSAVSAHSLLIKAETKLEEINEVIFYFDTNYFCSKFELDKSEEIASAVDTMINGYLYATTELIKRIDQKKEKILVSFLLKEYPSKLEALSSKNTLSVPASGIVSAAQAAFISIAESFSTYISDRSYLSVLLAKCNQTNEIYKNEKLIGDWLSTNMVSVEAMKNPQTTKQASIWNKVGSKVQTGFSLFK